jgi:NAD(P)-dependent dehydrogenase (short-subunit alcohol dehydrogenase family)
MRLRDKVAIVVGAGQTPGETIGNGRATALLFAREGARVLAVDRDHDSAAETVERITAEGGVAAPPSSPPTSPTRRRSQPRWPTAWGAFAESTSCTTTWV